MSSISTRRPIATTSVAFEALVWQAAAAVTLLGIGTWLFWDFLYRQVRWAITQQADWGHTLVVPFIAGYFVHLNRSKIFAEPFRTAWTGLPLMIIGLGWYMLCAIGPQQLQHHNLQSAGVWLTLCGLVLLFFGWRSMTWLWFPLLYLLVFGQYISERFLNIVTFQMQDVTARGAHVVMSLFLDIERNGNTLLIDHAGVEKPLNIAEACSGMRMLMAFLALGVAMAYTGLKRPWQRVALVIMAVPTAIFVNILRVVTLGVLSLADTGFAAGDFHSFVGLVWLVPAFLIYMGLMWIISHLIVEQERPAARPGESHAR